MRESGTPSASTSIVTTGGDIREIDRILALSGKSWEDALLGVKRDQRVGATSIHFTTSSTHLPAAAQRRYVPAGSHAVGGGGGGGGGVTHCPFTSTIPTGTVNCTP